jgi:hypothetical protein
MCECMKVLADQLYFLPNLLQSGQYFIPATRNGKTTNASYLLVRYCPNCGARQDDKSQVKP